MSEDDGIFTLYVEELFRLYMHTEAKGLIYTFTFGLQQGCSHCLANTWDEGVIFLFVFYQCIFCRMGLWILFKF